MNIRLIKLYTSIIYGVCRFTLTVRYSVGQFVIQIVKVVNIGQIYLYRVIYGVCLFTLKARYSIGQFVIQIEKLMNVGLYNYQQYLWSFYIHCYSSLFCVPVRYSNRKSNEYSTNIFIQYYLWGLSYIPKFVIQLPSS